MARISLTDNSIRHSRWLLPVLLVLFIMVMATIPAVLGVTYSGRSEDPDHTLSYIAGELYRRIIPMAAARAAIQAQILTPLNCIKEQTHPKLLCSKMGGLFSCSIDAKCKFSFKTGAEAVLCQ